MRDKNKTSRVLSFLHIHAILADLGEDFASPAVSLTPEIVKDFQKKYSLVADGIPGLKTQRLIQDKLNPTIIPIPKGRKELESVYGTFGYKEGKGGRITQDPDWVEQNIITVSLHDGHKVKLHKLLRHDFALAYLEATEASKYLPRSVQTHVARHIGWDAGNKLSTHSWGISVDFDPEENPMGGRTKKGVLSKFRQPGGIHFIEAFEKWGYTCGFRWKMKDDMHIQRLSV